MANDTKKKIAVFALITGVFGYLAGILTAPKSGKETRQDISNKAGEIKAESLEQLKKVEADLAKVMKDVQAKASKLGAKAREEYNEAQIRARDAQNKSKAVLKAVKSGQADNTDLDAAVKQSKDAIKSLSQYLKS